ncbi:terminase large subunit [Salmonella phage ST45]|nr:terminase large subunit [Salmonella phage ST45]WJJ60066.1 terminase large subunit [Salmonella phage ST37]WJJ60144.1 terminase large subunit [Salmonella phage ST35]WJJ60162.1 terminase large subunit [Salmonella phage ST34]WJJ60209.1 terminase large subunit [Salmonella phage ST29]WJJ60256.1 terminase large subunit [Salmonella phage ST21]WJJ60486.1 terminase large subunit [Salmonella phage ST15]WJJ60650.1 terminase large subunit [Salmonella phage ST3_da Silva-2023]WJJ60683.1 terminase large
MSNDLVARQALMTARMKADFVFFLFVLWKALSLPVPTRCQIDMAKKLSAGDNRRFILQAFRGIGKSFITCAFVVWKLWNNPDLKFMIVSASKERADANSIFIKRIIDLMPQLQELKPKQGQRDAVISFDVGPAKPDHSPSVKSVGITGQLTGSRADILIADDVEVPNNSATQAARDRLSELVKEFDAILKPGGTIIYLGTPQNEMTLYRELEGRGYTTTIWPARYPRDRKDWQSYGDRLAPMLQAELEEDPEAFYWRPTDEVRFDDTDLKERELSYGKAGFALQFMLNPNLSDAEKYPLKLRDLIVADLDPESSPMVYQWLPNPQNKREDVPNVGLMGDSYHTYQTVGSAFSSYAQKILVIDPSGRGKDETGYAVLYQLNGYIFAMEVGGMRGGYEDSTLEALAKIGRKWKVNEYVIEGNFGDGMYLELFKPVAARIHPAAVTEVKSKGQKELRICDVLEPIMGSHRLIVNAAAIVQDYQSASDKDGVRNPIYSLFYQMTRISRERGALAHDDRLDALAIGVQFFVESMAKDANKGEREVTEEWLEEQMENPRKGFESIHTEFWDNGVRVTHDTEDELGLGSYVTFH